jgi:hypothetical protein
LGWGIIQSELAVGIPACELESPQHTNWNRWRGGNNLVESSRLTPTIQIPIRGPGATVILSKSQLLDHQGLSCKCVR